MAVTCQLRPTPGMSEMWLSQWEAGGLLKTSVIKAVFATIEQRLVIRSLGRPHASDEIALRKAIGAIIG